VILDQWNWQLNKLFLHIMQGAEEFDQIDAALPRPEHPARITPSGIRSHADQLPKVTSKAEVDCAESCILSRMACLFKLKFDLQ